MPFQVGQRVGDYEVIQLLGAGGMGHVYRVRNIISNRTEAMKVLLPDLTAEPDLATRFISEIRTLASFDHPNIALLHTALQADNQLIMMMEFVEGYTLEQVARQRSIPVSEVAGYISQALSALAYAHERGVIHRDIKPANLMVTSHGIVKLMDFGIAKSSGENNNHTKPGTTMGSLYYMSPEQVRGSGVDPRSDLYSVGIVLYELLAGRRPFEADTTFSILNQQLNVLPQPPIEVNPSLPPRLNEIILRALAKDPAHRFQNAEEFRNALRPFCNAPSGQEVFAPATQVMPAPTPPPQANYSAVPTPPPQQQQAYAAPYANAPIPPQNSGSGKAIWIATGAIAVILALVGVGFAVPHLLRTHAASSSAAPADASVTTTPTTVATIPAPETKTIQPDITSNTLNSTPPPSAPSPVTVSPAPAPVTRTEPAPSTPMFDEPRMRNPDGRHDGMNGGNFPPRGGRQNQPRYGGFNPPINNAPMMNSSPNSSPNAPADTGAVDEARERMTQITARARSAKRGVGQIRSQQESMGLGMRGDVESAEARLDSYLEAAHGDLGRGNGAAANRDLDKADMELVTLERFLGH